MTKNENKTDRVIRVVLAAVFFLAGLIWLSAPWSYVLYALSAIMIVTAATGFCALYKLFGIDTTKPSSTNLA